MPKTKIQIKKFPWILSLTLLAIFFLIPLLFFILLNSKSNSGFGLTEILFSIVFSLITTLFLVWIRTFISNRPYLGVIIGLIVIISSAYALFIRYRGPYTLTFVIITGLLVIVYLAYNFIKFRKENQETRDDFNDDLSRQK